MSTNMCFSLILSQELEVHIVAFVDEPNSLSILYVLYIRSKQSNQLEQQHKKSENKLTITKGGLGLFGSATKKLDFSHHAYHLVKLALNIIMAW